MNLRLVLSCMQAVFLFYLTTAGSVHGDESSSHVKYGSLESTRSFNDGKAHDLAKRGKKEKEKKEARLQAQEEGVEQLPPEVRSKAQEESSRQALREESSDLTPAQETWQFLSHSSPTGHELRHEGDPLPHPSKQQIAYVFMSPAYMACLLCSC